MALRIHRNAIIVLIAAGFGLGAAWLSTRYLDERVADIENRSRQVMVQAVVAKESLAAGTPLTPENMAVRPVPAEWLHSGAIVAEQVERALGSTLRMPARGGEALLWSQLESERQGRFSSALLPGRRAATVPVDEINSLSGMLEPGDVIDLLVTVSRDRRNLTFPLLQSVRVLASGARTRAADGPSDGRDQAFTTITLDLSPEQAAQLVAARSIGRLTALLRAPGDHAPILPSQTDALALLGLIERRERTRPPVPVIYGGAGNPLFEVQALHLRSARADAAAAPVSSADDAAIGARLANTSATD